MTGWADKIAWVRRNVVVTAVTCRLAAPDVLVSIDKVVSAPVEMLYSACTRSKNVGFLYSFLSL